MPYSVSHSYRPLVNAPIDAMKERASAPVVRGCGRGLGCLPFPVSRPPLLLAGLTPNEHSSADHLRRGHISKQGSPWLRWVMVEAAIHALRDPELREFF